MLTLDIPDNIRTALTAEVTRIDAQLTQTVDKPTQIQLNIQLAPALAAQVPAGASLFVFVQSPGGGPPLAVKRLDASLPRQLVLSAADSMMPTNKVTPNQKVHVVARISASGRPIASAGDLSGELDTVAGQGGEHVLLISQVTPAGN
jgi:cytochrome c-type biogenesis protein CcmH